MRALIIDGMGGGIGKAIIEHLKKSGFDGEIIAVGTNAAAAGAMLKAGADVAATGENAAVFNCGGADFIIGAVGIAMANAMHGEISPTIARAVCESGAKKILVPLFKCNAVVVGVQPMQLAQYIEEIPRHMI